MKTKELYTKITNEYKKIEKNSQMNFLKNKTKKPKKMIVGSWGEGVFYFFSEQMKEDIKNKNIP